MDMENFKGFIERRDKQAQELDENWWANLANAFQYNLGRVGASPEQKAQANAIDNFGNFYKGVQAPLTQKAAAMDQLQLPAADELTDKVQGVGKKFDKVIRKRPNGVPVRNFG